MEFRNLGCVQRLRLSSETDAMIPASAPAPAPTPAIIASSSPSGALLPDATIPASAPAPAPAILYFSNQNGCMICVEGERNLGLSLESRFPNINMV